MTTADLLLHPVRLRVVQEFLGRGELTTADLREALADVPVASLYRHITTLLRADVLSVTDERKVRGAVERTYVLNAAAASVSDDEAATMSADDHRQAFMTFVAGLLGSFDRYVEGGPDDSPPDLARDQVGYRQATFNLSDDEMASLLTDLRAVIEPRMSFEATPERTRRSLTTIVMPAR